MRSRHWIVASLLSAALAAGLVVWQPWKPSLKNFGTVTQGKIYRMGRTTPAGLERLVREKQIKTVIDFGSDPEGTPEDTREAETCRALGVDRVVLRLEGDGTGDPNRYVEALRVMTDPSRQPVLVHCGAGSQRTGAATILYRHFIEGKPILEVYPEAWEYRHKPGKDWRMLAYLADWSDEIGEAFREGGKIVGPNEVVRAEQPEPNAEGEGKSEEIAQGNGAQ
ncbi:MAG: tyrosine-protein phosphatase [Phycisphaerales bacterium]